MFRTLAFLILSSLTLHLFGQNLDEYRWEQRLIVLFYGEDQEELVLRQLAEFKKNADGLEDRRLLVVHVKNGKYQTGLSCEEDWSIVSDERLQRIPRRRFQVVLIGLDGGVKLEQADFLSCLDLFSIIDRMPMRRQELKDGG